MSTYRLYAKKRLGAFNGVLTKTGAPLMRKAPPRAFNVSNGQATWGTARQISRRYLITRTRYIDGICLSASMVLLSRCSSVSNMV